MTIDGKDILSEYGCMPQEGCFDDILKYPKRKAVSSHNWAEINGIDPDLSKVEFEPKTVKLNLLFKSDSNLDFWNKYNKLITDLSAPEYREICAISGLTNRLRLNTSNSFSSDAMFDDEHNISEISISMIEDDISIPVVNTPSFNAIGLKNQLSINGIDFSEFGIGCDDNLGDILKYPGIKDPFTDGNTVDLKTIKLQHKEMKLSLWMIANSVEEFVNHYSSFFTQFNTTDTQDLYFNVLGETIKVYYTDCPNYSVDIWNNDFIATRFTLSLVIPVVTWIDGGGSTIYRVLMDSDSGKLLADENNKILVFN